MLRVLSIDGGGIRGIIPAMVLQELERRTGRPTVDLFDLVAGTSTGAILVLALVSPRENGSTRPASEVAGLYLESGGLIFPLGGVPLVGLPPKGNRLFGVRAPAPPDASMSDRFKNMLGWDNTAKLSAVFGGGKRQGNARYPAEPLERALREQVGDTLMSRALRPVVVVSCDFNTGMPLLFRGGGLSQEPLGDAEMWQAARATSAGPTFFPAFKYHADDGTTYTCVDGGLVANDPAFVAYTEGVASARSNPAADNEILLVSLGTGQKRPDRAPELDDVEELIDQRTWAGLAPQLMHAMAGGGGELIRQQLAQLLGDRYVRLQTTLVAGANHAMDDVRPENVDALRRTGDQLIAEYENVIQQLTVLL